MQGLVPDAYLPFAGPIFAVFAQPSAVTTEQEVAEGGGRLPTIHLNGCASLQGATRLDVRDLRTIGPDLRLIARLRPAG